MWSHLGRTIRKVMGGGGWGILELHNFFSVNIFLVQIFFRLLHEYFLGLSCMREFFSVKFSLALIYFFVLHHPPPLSLSLTFFSNVNNNNNNNNSNNINTKNEKIH